MTLASRVLRLRGLKLKVASAQHPAQRSLAVFGTARKGRSQSCRSYHMHYLSSSSKSTSPTSPPTSSPTSSSTSNRGGNATPPLANAKARLSHLNSRNHRYFTTNNNNGNDDHKNNNKDDNNSDYMSGMCATAVIFVGCGYWLGSMLQKNRAEHTDGKNE